MKYVTCDFAPKNDFSRKLTLTDAGSKDFEWKVLGGETGFGRGFGAARAGAWAPERGPDEPVDPGDDATVDLCEPDPPHAASARASRSSGGAVRRHMAAILAPSRSGLSWPAAL
jgi:hypothetical protein